uniref:NAB co-repressor domain-containing protein n=1 Tax=Trichuris muris TaxID=70415 RepID=A0A5S6Q7J5_TRIMR
MKWQLYLVLQRANLLQYYDTFISQGGDDVQQLLEAGEEEFLEIMALVGMASKPLHVRRLQKTLQEYGSNPTTFQLVALQKSGLATTTTSVAQLIQSAATVAAASISFCNAPAALHPLLPIAAPSQSSVGPCSSESPGMLNTQSNGAGSLWHSSLSDNADFAFDSYNFSGASSTLTEGQVYRLSECATALAKSLPEYEPKMIQNKKKIGRDLLNVMEMPDHAPNRLGEFRKYAAIYGRFDAKRKADKPLTFHEVSVNEAAAQICLHRPALLTRRDELFPLARQVVRDAGYSYLKAGTAGRSESETDLISLDMNRKRSTPAESLSSGGDKSPASCTSNYSQPSPLPSQDSADRRSVSPYHSSSEVKRRRRIDDISLELSNILQEQESYKHRVDEAQDLDELHAIQRELQRLTQRQLELTDEQAELTMYCSVRERTTVKEEPCVELETSETEDVQPTVEEASSSLEPEEDSSRTPAQRMPDYSLETSSGQFI